MTKSGICIFFALIYVSEFIYAQSSSQHNSYPNYNIIPIEPDSSGMSFTASELAARIKVGWNLGNTLEATGGETSWGNPLVTRELIQLVKKNGFNAIRIPCSWNVHLDSATAKIKSSWLNRVKQVVQYCVDNDMYVILNIHWDGGWLENNVTQEKQADVNAKQRAFWEQIATCFRDFDEHLIFAGANEPNVENAAQMEILRTYQQTFIDAVRSTGGRNRYRVLVVQGPSTDIEKTCKLMTSLPLDHIAHRMMVEIHYYTPYQFCLMPKDANWGKAFYYWGKGYHSTTDTIRNASWGEEAQLDKLMESMKSKFVDQGIPVILGEYAVIRRTSLTGEALDLHLASRAYFLEYVTRQAKANGLLPFYWDAGNMGENSSALFDRQTNKVYDQQALDAIMQGAESILETAHRVADWQLEHRKDTTMLDWIQGPFLNGMMAIGSLPGGEKYIQAVKEIGSQEKWGVVQTQWRANDLCTPQSWIEMFEIEKKPEMIAPIRKELDQIMDIVSKQDNGLEFIEKNNMKWSWCDALYMAPPTFARMGKVTGDQKYYDFLNSWWWKVSDYYYEPEEHLYFRDQNYFTRREPNGAKVFWSRGNGWVIGGLVRVLQYLPANDPVRPKYEQQLREMCLKLKDIQGQDGLWHSGLLDPVSHSQDETSGSAFFVYGMAYAINEGIVEKEAFGESVTKAWNALCTYVNPDGCFTGIQPIGDSPVVYDKNFSMPYGVGAFLLAASEMYRLQEK